MTWKLKDLLLRWLLPVFLLFIFFFSGNAHASVLYSQTNQNTTSTFTTNDGWLFQPLGTGLVGSVNRITAKIASTTGSPDQYRLRLLQFSGNTYDLGAATVVIYGICTAGQITNNLIDVRTDGTGPCPSVVTSSQILDPTKLYALDFGDPSFYNNVRVLGSTNSADWSGGIFELNTDATLKQAYFTIEGTSSPATVSFDFPVASSSNADFKSWILNISNTTPDQYPITVKVNYGLSSSSFRYQDSQVSPTAGVVFKKYSLAPLNSTFPITWYAQAQVFNLNGTSIGTSSVIHFDITTSTVLLPQVTQDYLDAQTYYSISGYSPTTTQQQTCSYNCQQYDGSFFSSSTIQGLACYARQTVCYAGVALFQPSADFKTTFSQSILAFQSVFPFSIVFQFVSSSQSAATNGYDSSSSYSFAIPMIKPTGASLTLLSSSSLSNVVGSSTKNVVFNYERGAIWISTAIAILFTVL